MGLSPRGISHKKQSIISHICAECTDLGGLIKHMKTIALEQNNNKQNHSFSLNSNQVLESYKVSHFHQLLSCHVIKLKMEVCLLIMLFHEQSDVSLPRQIRACARIRDRRSGKESHALVRRQDPRGGKTA